MVREDKWRRHVLPSKRIRAIYLIFRNTNKEIQELGAYREGELQCRFIALKMVFLRALPLASMEQTLFAFATPHTVEKITHVCIISFFASF